MYHYISPLDQWIRPAQLPADELGQRTPLIICALALIPAIVALTFYSLRSEGWTVTTILYLIGVGFNLLSLAILRYSGQYRFFLRIVLAYFLLMNTTILAVGGSNQLGYCWFYLFPLLTYYILGTREGIYWTGLSWLAALTFGLLNLGSYAYPRTTGIRFLITYSQVIFLAHALEAYRAYYYAQLLAEKEKLEKSLQEVNTLQSLLPICANCKMIRDDEGYWHQVEQYMQEHAGMEFSHGICPECRGQPAELVNAQQVAAD